uniref:Uncharacterized protein n=1 Tax=Arundo donax TaxID=35708 RepID=A0A0A9H6X3_ARUDO
MYGFLFVRPRAKDTYIMILHDT